MRAVLVDTGPLYALVDPDDQHHARAREEAERLQREAVELVLAYPTLLEAYTLVMRRLGVPAARRWVGEALQGCGLLNPVAEDYLEATERIGAFEDQPITLFDSVVALLAGRLDIPVWTYDHHFDLMRVEVWR